MTRAPQDITLHDIYKAVEGEKPLLHLNKDINAECQVGTKIQMALQDAYDEVQNAAEAKMKNIPCRIFWTATVCMLPILNPRK